MVPLSQHGLVRLTTASISSLAALAFVIALPAANAADDETPAPPKVEKSDIVSADNPEVTKPPVAPDDQAPVPVPEPAVDATSPKQASNLFPIGSRERPFVLRTFLPNLIEDPAVFTEHRASAPATNRDNDEVIEPEQGLPAAIAVSFGKDLAIAWDSVECRWIYAWRGGFLDMSNSWEVDSDGPRKDSSSLPEIVGDLEYLASGPAPLSVSLGSGPVKFYGYRLVDGVPEFLYTVGRLKVTERLQPGDDGETIVQHFSVERQVLDLMLSAPSQALGQDGKDSKSESKEAEDSVTVINGKRSGDYVLVSVENAGDFTLIHQIGPAASPADAPKPPVARPIPLLTQNEAGETPGGEKAMPKPVPKAKPVDVPPPAPKPKEPQRIIAKAERYDRNILLNAPQLEPGAMKPESLAFADRDFKFAELPEELIGADYVRTYDRDKYIPGEILNYRLKLDADATVYLLFDSRLEPLPEWTEKRFVDTGKTASLDSETDFRILRGNADAGELRLGPQDSGAGAHFYIIAVTPRTAPPTQEKQE